MAGLNSIKKFVSPRLSFYGYEVRDPYQGERSFFESNKQVAGMAADDGKITLNPYSPMTHQQRMSVAQNEAARLWMRDRKFKPDFGFTAEQMKLLSGSEYVKPENQIHMQHTLLARALTGDSSSGALTKQQQDWLAKLKKGLLENR